MVKCKVQDSHPGETDSSSDMICRIEPCEIKELN